MNIIIVDDDPVVTASLKTILEADEEVCVLATGSDGEDAVRLFREHSPDIALLDIRMQKMTGIEAAKAILAKDKNAKILFLTTFSDDEYIVAAINMGAKGYILKQDFDQIIPALKAVYAGQNVLGSDVITRLPSLMEMESKADLSRFGLDAREQEIVSMVADGLSNREIAQTVFLSEGTVRNYVSIILEKLDLRDRTQLAVFYYRNR
ncbi:MAG: response regulator [Christensenellaceae bacterium]|jgi:DNA-binding NarL/FixJ family response regulator